MGISHEFFVRVWRLGWVGVCGDFPVERRNTIDGVRKKKKALFTTYICGRIWKRI